MKTFAIWRQPLIQFLIIGALLFALEGYITSQQDDPRHIVIDDARLAELTDIFVEGQGREPSTKEKSRLILTWAQNEMLYREALLMGLDKGDEMIHSRLILKMRNVMFNNAVVDPPSDEKLREFYEFNAAQYQPPVSFDVEFIRLAEGSEQSAAIELSSTANSGSLPTEQKDELRTIPNSPLPVLAAMFGESGATTLTAAPEQEWQAIEANDQWVVARTVERHEPKEVDLEDVRSRVIRDWSQFENDRLLAEQTKALADKYTVSLELAPGIMDDIEKLESDTALEVSSVGSLK